jgi:hypothetical protein
VYLFYPNRSDKKCFLAISLSDLFNGIGNVVSYSLSSLDLTIVELDDTDEFRSSSACIHYIVSVSSARNLLPVWIGVVFLTLARGGDFLLPL